MEGFDFSLLDSDQPWIIPERTDNTDCDEGLLMLDHEVDEGQTDANVFRDNITDAFHIDSGTLTLETTPSLLNESCILPVGLEEDSPDGVALLFHRQTRHILSIYEEPSKNPWTNLVWPMVKDSKALYHAIAAMAYLQLSKSKPSIRDKGIAHVHKSSEALAADLQRGTIQMDAALAATIALGFAETWDYQKSSTGRNHIKGASILLQQSLSSYASSQPTSDTSTRLRFLANTWIYMDAIARLTSDCGSPFNSELLSIFSVGNPVANSEELDPLMGYAGTLFPVIGRVADLISQIRSRSPRRNSPAIISRAIDMKNAIEKWTPAIDLEHVDHPTSNMSDAIQTAEAYRWSTLLLLQQAVPELPNLASFGELAQKTLVYLATIPIKSRTIIVHTYPLMVAGSEAVDEEDREFVRARWKSMGKRMISGIVDRCLEITEEVWRRRDVYLADQGLAANWGGSQCSSPNRDTRSPGTIGVSVDDITAAEESDAVNIDDAQKQTSPVRQFVMPRSPVLSDFPISAAFKKGVDILTRSGNVEYTVKGKLHWLGVMKEWGWEGKYCLIVNTTYKLQY